MLHPANAMARGALVGMLAAIVALSSALLGASLAPYSPWAPSTFTIAPHLLLGGLGASRSPISLVWPGAWFVAAAGATGGAIGILASRLRGGVRRRAWILLALSPLGPALVGFATFALPPLFLTLVGSAVSGTLPDPGALRVVPYLEVFLPLIVLPYLPALTVFLAPPIVVGHLVVEGWTRPSTLPVSGFARPGPRRVVLLAAVVVVTTFTVLGVRR